MKCVLHWFRRDLRLHDNTALAAAVAEAEEVVPVFIVSDWREKHGWTGAPRQEFLCGTLRVLAENLKRAGGRLIILRGRADLELAKLLEETKADGIFFQRDPDPFGRAMEKKVARLAEKKGVACRDFKDVAMHERDEVRTGGGEPFQVFTPYAKAWRKLAHPAVQPVVQHLRTPKKVASLGLPKLDWWDLTASAQIIAPGENAARQRLEQFLTNGLTRYAKLRDQPAAEATSRFSADLRFGTLSPREIFFRCAKAAQHVTAAERQSIHTFTNELIWREFYSNVLWHRPEVLQTDFKPKYRAVKWKAPGSNFTRWCEGATGFPIVDAAMRQLHATGFMHNRLRMITAMFLTKDLHVYWQAGERYFMQRLVDGDIASNNGGWQWSAGTGADAAPYFRVQNPWRQTERYDPDGAFIKKWVPELRDVPAEKLRRPPSDGVSIARNYPAPMVDHAREREVALEMFRAVAKK